MNEQREEMHELEPLLLQHPDIKKKMKKSTKIVLTITAIVLISLVVLFVVKKILPAIERNQNMKVYKQEGYIEQDAMKLLLDAGEISQLEYSEKEISLEKARFELEGQYVQMNISHWQLMMICR